MIPLIGAALVAAVLALYLDQRAERRAAHALAAQQQARIAEVLEEVASLRSALLASGTAERTAKLPPCLPEAGGGPQTRVPRATGTPVPKALGPFPSVDRKVVSVTRDDDPIHTRATIEAPAPDGWRAPSVPPPRRANGVEVDPPSTQPSPSRARRRERASGERPESSPTLETSAAVRARIEAEEDARDRARARRELPALPHLDEDDNRPTGETFGEDERTRVFSKRPAEVLATIRLPPHAPPRPRSERPTLYDGMLRAPPPTPTASRASMKTMPSAPSEPGVPDDHPRQGGAA